VVRSKAVRRVSHLVAAFGVPHSLIYSTGFTFLV
jgi:hypothetical protein